MTSPSSGARVLIGSALGCFVVLTVWLWRLAWADSGAFAVLLFGIPLACAGLALWAETTTSPRAPAVVGGLAAVSTAWSLVTGLGIGLALLLPSLLLLVAALASWTARRDQPRPLRG